MYAAAAFFYCIKKWSRKKIHDRKENKRQRGENKIHKLCVCIAQNSNGRANKTRHTKKERETKENQRCNEILCTRILWVFIFIILQVIKLHFFFRCSKDNCTAVVIRSSSAWGYSACLFFLLFLFAVAARQFLIFMKISLISFIINHIKNDLKLHVLAFV